MSVLKDLTRQFDEAVTIVPNAFDEDVVMVERSSLMDVMAFLKGHSQYPFNLLLDICGVDYLGDTPRFEVVYHLYSMSTHARLRVRSKVPEDHLSVHSMITLWKCADWFEREAYDMYGIRFEGHPNLKRLLMWEKFEGYPLRKDYPLNKRQAIPTPDDLV